MTRRQVVILVLVAVAAFVWGHNVGQGRILGVLQQTDAALTKANDALLRGIKTMDALNMALQQCQSGKAAPRQTVALCADGVERWLSLADDSGMLCRQSDAPRLVHAAAGR